jgi:hypothetical protein
MPQMYSKLGHLCGVCTVYNCVPRDVLNIIARTIVGRSFHKVSSLTDSWGGGGGVG